MFCLSCRPIVKLSDEGKRISKHLETLTYTYILLAILKLLLGDFNNFLNDFLTVLMVVLTYVQANYFMASLLIFMLSFQAFFLMTGFLLILQNYYIGYLIIISFINYFYIFLILCTLIVNILLIHFSFLAYREYKALYLEQSQISYDYGK